MQVRFHGACNGCPSSNLTLHMGIERNLRELLTFGSAGCRFARMKAALPQFVSGLRVFLCHASEDKQAAEELYNRLRADGFLPWLDKEDF